MSGRKFFLIWTLVFAALGVTVPILLTLGFLIFQRDFGATGFLWPSSIMFMALDTPAPAPRSTVIIIYIIAAAENVLLYGVVGAVTSPVAWAVRRILGHHQ